MCHTLTTVIRLVHRAERRAAETGLAGMRDGEGPGAGPSGWTGGPGAGGLAEEILRVCCLCPLVTFPHKSQWKHWKTK